MTAHPAKLATTTPYWAASATFPQFAKLAEDLETEVVVVCAGMTGLSAAYLLARAGKRVVVLERDRCAMTDTGHTRAPDDERHVGRHRHMIFREARVDDAVIVRSLRLPVESPGGYRRRRRSGTGCRSSVRATRRRSDQAASARRGHRWQLTALGMPFRHSASIATAEQICRACRAALEPVVLDEARCTGCSSPSSDSPSIV